MFGKLDGDKVPRTVRHVRALIAERELLFRDLGVASMGELRARRAAGELEGEEVADVFLLIDNWAALRRDYEDLDLEVEEIANAGLNFGVHVAVSANRWGEIRPNLRDNLGSRFELRLNDPVDSEVGKRIAQTVPEGVPGRGLTAEGLHFQTARPTTADLRRAAELWAGPAAREVPILPMRLDLDDLPRGGTAEGVPIGVDELRLDPVVLDLAGADPHFLVLGDSEAGKSSLLRAFAHGLIAGAGPDRAQLVIVDYRRSLIDLAEGAHTRAYAANGEMAAAAVGELVDELRARMPGPQTSREELLRGPTWSGPRYYLLVDDYDLVPAATGNPLDRLVELLPHGRDLGLHLLLARRVGGTARSAFEPVYQRLTELGTPGLIMSGEHQEGPLLGGSERAICRPGAGCWCAAAASRPWSRSPSHRPGPRPGPCGRAGAERAGAPKPTRVRSRA